MAILATIHDSVRAGLGWKEQMKGAIRDPRELARRLDLPTPSEQQIQACKQFGLFVPESFLNRMCPGDSQDPLLLQVLPKPEEVQILDGFSADPLEESQAKRTNGLLQKYHGRVLLIANSVCAVNCRYCFRRHFPYEQTPHADAQWNEAIQEIADDASIREVIFSGGDPLTLVDSKLKDILEKIDQIDHVSRIRFHTRLPVVIPERITSELTQLFESVSSNVIVVIHSNHPKELDDQVGDVLQKLREAGCQLLNQSVLLRNVNDDSETLIELSNRLIDLGVIPYYLHQLDRVQGAGHFETEIAQGKRLIAKMRSQLPGYAVPRYVCEEPGKPNKTVIA